MFRGTMMFALLVLVFAGLATPAASQFATQSGRISVEPYVAYGFFGQLPDNGPELDAAVAYGGRLAYKLSPQFALFGNVQRSEPSDVTVDHFSAGIEFDYAPRGGAEGLIPLLLEAGIGQVRYGDSFGNASDLAANLGIASAFRLSPNFAIRYGINDYISNYADSGLVNQVFARIGGELRF